MSKILSEQASSESRLDIQRAYDRIKVILSHKSDPWFEHSIKVGRSQQARDAEKKQIIDRLLKMFEKKIEMSGMAENFDRTEDEEELADSKIKVRAKHIGSVCASRPPGPGSILGVAEIFIKEKLIPNFDVAEFK